jgi:hypothetical protein
MKALPANDFKDLFDYDPDSGVLLWKKRPTSHFPTERGWKIFNRVYSGKVAGYKDYQGETPTRIKVGINGVVYPVHQIVWHMTHGPIPDGMVIDHKDGNPFNNKLDNLRLSTRSQNMWNSRMRKSNALGFKGVSKQRRKFVASISKNGKPLYLGRFPTPEEAHAAYCKASDELHGQFGRHR